jgi:hypothetical protein
MKQILIILAAGIAAAMLQFALARNTGFAFLLAYFSPLPLMVAAMGWGWQVGFFAGVFATIILMAFGLTKAGLIFFLAVALPALWLSILLQSARQVKTENFVSASQQNTPMALQFYPLSSLLFWAAGISAAVTLISIMIASGSVLTFQADLQTALQESMTALQNTPGFQDLEQIGPQEKERLISFIANTLPLFIAALWCVILIMNLLLSARITNFSQLSLRPAPNIAQMSVSIKATLIFAAALALSFLPGFLGLVAGIIAAAFAAIHLFAGLGAAHRTLRGNPMRTPLLVLLYLLILFTGWPVVFLIMLGAFKSLKPPLNPPTTPHN